MNLRGTDIICFSSIDWDFIWQGHQEIMSALAEQGNRVLFVDNTGVRAPVLRDLPRVGKRVRNWWRGTQGFRRERPNLFVYSPLVLPLPYLRVARWLNRALMLRSLRRWMRATGFSPAVVWTFLPTQLVVDLVDRLDPDVLVYYCIADFEQLASRADVISKSERALVARTDVLFVQGEMFRARFEGHPNTHIFPFGVKMAAFEAAPGPAPELADVKRPIVGYIGGLHQHVDQTLVERVRFLGQQPHERLPDFIRAFDVGIIPYLRTPYTESVYPTKLNEYLAAGIPVVTTALPEIERFNREFGGVVSVAGDADGFVEAVREAVDDRAPGRVARRIDVARENSWDVRIDKMAVHVAQALRERRTMGVGWEDSLRRLYRRSRGRLAGAAVAAVTLYLLLFATPFVWWVAAPLKVTAPPERADVIVVFAGGVGESGRAGGGYQERVKKAVDLYQAGRASTLIMVSGYVFAFPEAALMKDLAVSHGVPEGAIILETNAANTHESVVSVSRVLVERGWARALLVSSPYHMRRALLVWRKAAPGTEAIPAPVTQSQFYTHGAGATLEQMRGIFHEYAAIGAYWWRGWI